MTGNNEPGTIVNRPVKQPKRLPYPFALDQLNTEFPDQGLSLPVMIASNQTYSQIGVPPPPSTDRIKNEAISAQNAVHQIPQYNQDPRSGPVYEAAQPIQIVVSRSARNCDTV